MSDRYAFESSSASQVPEEPYKSKQYSYIQDTNNSQNPTQLKFTLDGFRSNDKFVSPSEMYLQIPLVLAASGTAADGFVNTAYINSAGAVAMKSGYWNLIQSMSVMLDNKEVVQITPNTNFYSCFKFATSASLDDVASLGGTLGFQKDSSTSWQWRSAVSACGIGLCNNTAGQTAWTSATATTNLVFYGDDGNDGLRKRLQMDSAYAASTGKWSAIKSVANFQNELKNYVGIGAARDATDYMVKYISAVIRLRDLSDLFEKLPLCRGFNATLTINLNVGNVSITKSASATGTLTIAGLSVSNNGTLPFTVNKYGTNFDWLTTVGATVSTIAVGVYYGSVRTSAVGSQTSLAIPANPQPIARIYAPMIELKPEFALSYLSESKQKLVVYRDLLYFNPAAVSAGGSFNIQLAPSINNMKGLLVIPMIASSSNIVFGTAATEFQSPFDTCPATTAPLSIYNFNVQLSSQNVFQQNIQYGYEQFIHETSGAYAVNGGIGALGINSGLIDFVDWDNIYKFYYVDLSRRLKDDNLGKSISLLGNNNNLLALDLHCFIEVEKSLIIDVESGRVLELRV